MNDGEISEAWRFWDTSDFKDGEVTFPSFHSLFSTERTQLDIDGDGTTSADDAELAIAMIVQRVRQGIAPYDLNIIVGDQDDHRDMFHNDILGDALAIISGGIDNTTFRDTPAGGWAGYDEGNPRDGLALAFTGSRGSMSLRRCAPESFRNAVIGFHPGQNLPHSPWSPPRPFRIPPRTTRRRINCSQNNVISGEN